MKKVLSTLVAALVAVSFAGIVCAAEPAPAAAPEMKKEEKAPVKKARKVKKVKKAKKVEKKEEAPAAK
jgi:Spy/CpxP family protein refolding chaperone